MFKSHRTSQSKSVKPVLLLSAAYWKQTGSILTAELTLDKVWSRSPQARFWVLAPNSCLHPHHAASSSHRSRAAGAVVARPSAFTLCLDHFPLLMIIIHLNWISKDYCWTAFDVSRFKFFLWFTGSHSLSDTVKELIRKSCIRKMF